MICYIPSKGRPSSKTHRLFTEAGIEVLHFVEPQDVAEYIKNSVPQIVDIGANDQGIGFVRNYMLQYAKDKGHEWVVICDDDVTSFGIYNGKAIKLGASIWKDLHQMAIKLPYDIFGINYQQHCWHEKTAYSINRKWSEVCVLMHMTNIKWQYDRNVDYKEDRDFLLQCIKHGNGTCRFNRYWFACPSVGTNAGGLQSAYRAKLDEIAAKKMVIKWHPHAKLQVKGTRLDFKIDFKSFAAANNKTYK